MTNIIDPKILFLTDVLDLQHAHAQLQSVVPHLARVTAATLVRHKPGRRALIEYHLETDRGVLTLLGKVRAKGTDWNSYHIQNTLWCNGFDADSADSYSVPEPIGVIPDWHMTLQRKVPGVPATDQLLNTDGGNLARRIAGLACKLHSTPVYTIKTHTLEDELRILRDRLVLVSHDFPKWSSRIDWVLAACHEVVSSLSLSQTPATGIHRDFYSDQVLVDGDRLWLVDLDLYCQGHPALDIGNFIAHITEYSLRSTGSPTSLLEQETALQQEFITRWISQASLTMNGDGEMDSYQRLFELVDELRAAIALYTVLTLVRHIYISTRIPERHSVTEPILLLCESRLQDMLQSKGEFCALGWWA